MPDGTTLSASMRDGFMVDGADEYAPPLGLILAGLDTTELAMSHDRVNVSAAFLRFLIGEFARTLPFDPIYYARAYPDVEAARLAGDVATLHEHFIHQGYFERRRPCEMAFDPSYYHDSYEDLARSMTRADPYTLRAHFTDHGWQEGRAGGGLAAAACRALGARGAGCGRRAGGELTGIRPQAALSDVPVVSRSWRGARIYCTCGGPYTARRPSVPSE